MVTAEDVGADAGGSCMVTAEAVGADAGVPKPEFDIFICNALFMM